MSYTESPVVFECNGDRLIGIVAKPLGEIIEVGVLIVVGGPQYRAGSHRQFTLLARDLAGSGISSLRFDYRGMGDSEGDSRTFEYVDEDINAAINAFFAHLLGVRSIVIWGLCDAATAALIYAYRDRRVSGLILLNPWAYTNESAAQVRLKYYYFVRLTQYSFWKKILTGKLDFKRSIQDFFDSTQVLVKDKISTASKCDQYEEKKLSTQSQRGNLLIAEKKELKFVLRMIYGLRNFHGKILIILSDNDLTAQEFHLLTKNHHGWRSACENKQIISIFIQEANHTFSSKNLRDSVTKLTADFIKSTYGRVDK